MKKSAESPNQRQNSVPKHSPKAVAESVAESRANSLEQFAVFSTDSLSTNPEARLCPKFDEKGIALFQLGSPEEMGFIVVDDCTQEHIQ